MNSFVVPCIEAVLKALTKVTLFSLFKKALKKYKWSSSHAFVDAWVLLNFLLSFIAAYTYNLISSWISWIFILFGILRIFELVVYQFSVLLVDQFRTLNYAIGGYRRMLIMSLLNYIEIMAWFGLFYLSMAALFKDDGGVLKSATGAIYYSLVTMSTLGYGEVTPLKDGVRAIVTLQTIIGMFLIILIISRVISYLPKPKTMDEDEIKSESEK